MAQVVVSNLPIGKNVRVKKDAPTGAGSVRVPFTIEAPDVFTTLYINNVVGTISVEIYQYVDHIDLDKRRILQDYGSFTSSDNDTLITRKAGAQLQQLYAEITYTDACEYEFWVRGAAQDESSVRVLGANTGRNSQTTIGTTPINVIPSALTDRAGVVIFNNSSSVTAYWGYTAAEATVTEGYPLLPKQPLGIDIAAGTTIFMRAETTTVDLRISEASS